MDDGSGLEARIGGEFDELPLHEDPDARVVTLPQRQPALRTSERLGSTSTAVTAHSHTLYAVEPMPAAEPAVKAVPRPARRRARKRATVSVVIPAKNEAANLPTVLSRIPRTVDEVLLVDGLSTDVTTLMATTVRPDIRVISEERPGKGYALQTGFHAAQGDLIVAIDADGSMTPDEIPHFVYFLEHGYDFVKGSRFVGGGGSFDITTMRRMGNRALLTVANRLHRTNFTDLCYGFFGFHRRFLDALGPLSAGFEIEAELTLRAVKAGLRIAEIPSLEMPRRNGQSSLRSFPDGARVLRTVLRERSGPRAARS